MLYGEVDWCFDLDLDLDLDFAGNMYDWLLINFHTRFYCHPRRLSGSVILSIITGVDYYHVWNLANISFVAWA